MNNRQSIRLDGYDYATPGWYFVTIDVQDKLKLFWDENEINEIGGMVEKLICEIPIFYNGILVDEYVVMPDHIHLIIEINHDGTIKLSEIIQRFKILSTNKYIFGVKNNNWPKFHRRLWQRDYYERIIRNGDELNRIRKYILENPEKWGK